MVAVAPDKSLRSRKTQQNLRRLYFAALGRPLAVWIAVWLAYSSAKKRIWPVVCPIDLNP